MPLAGITALQAVRDIAQVDAGQRVLVQGAGGGVGSFVTQIALARGAAVTAVCGPRSLDLVKAFGVDDIIDYTRQDLAGRDGSFDAIVAVNGRRSPREYRELLLPGGRLAMVGGANRQIFEGLLLAPLVFLGSGKAVQTLTIDDRRKSGDLRELARMIGEGTLRVQLAGRFPASEFREAFALVESGHVAGKVVLAF